MTPPIVFALPGNEKAGAIIARELSAQLGVAELRQFPDAETYLRIDTPLDGRDVVLVSTLDRPDTKLLSLHFFARLVKDLRARRVGLVAPYLPYMRQDRQFRPGEAVTSLYFAEIVSANFSWLVTVDPHLHRRGSLSELYTVPARVVHAAPSLGAWIREHVDSPVLIGPDEESTQWVKAVASESKAPFVVLEKVRSGDRDVSIRMPNVEGLRKHTPVVVDDIISTGRTMVETVRHLIDAGTPPPTCIGIHAVFAEGAARALRTAGAGDVVTSNTIEHETNAIDLFPALALATQEMLTY